MCVNFRCINFRYINLPKKKNYMVPKKLVIKKSSEAIDR